MRGLPGSRNRSDNANAITGTDKLPRYCHQLCSLHKLAIETGVTVKEAEELAGHSTPELTLNPYGRVREARLKEAVGRRYLSG